MRAVSDQYGAIQSRDGLDVGTLEAHVAATGSVVAFPGSTPLDPGALLLDVDVVVPAAVEGVIDTAVASQMRARIVVEGANGPTTSQADSVLAGRNVLVVPDILANAGGVIVSYFEWVQGMQSYWWSEAEVESKLAERVGSAWTAVTALADWKAIPLRQAAMATAVSRVAEAHTLRGLYP